MKTQNYREPVLTKIISIDGSDLLKRGYTALKNGKLDPDAFRGVMDDSLDTLKLEEVYKAHRADLPFPYLADKIYCRALVNVSFDYAVKEFEQAGRRFVRYGYTVTDSDMTDHVCVRNGELIAVEVPYQNDTQYAPVQQPIDADLLGDPFEYDAKAQVYRRSEKAIPSAITRRTVRERLYAEGFDIDGVHYVRYKRSAGASRDGRCMFIAEPLYADMMSWSECGLSPDIVTDQASWQAYLSLTMSSIEGVIRLPKKAILIIPDAVSTFPTDAVSVSETADHDLVAAEKEVIVKNKIWDGEALLDASVFLENGYEKKGMLLLRNRFFKTCAFNTNLQEWFADNCVTKISQLAGYTTARKIEDIKLVITESSLKYLKFMPKGMPYQEGFRRWLDAMYEGKDTSVFGVVKSDKPAPLMQGYMTYTNYQLLNTVGFTRDGAEKLLEDSLRYLDRVIKDPTYLRYHIHTPVDYVKLGRADIPDLETCRLETILDMTCRTPDFGKTDFYKSFRRDTVAHFRKKLKNGRIPVTGGYMTMFGNPYEFLCAVIDPDYVPDEPLTLGTEDIFTTAFPINQVVLCSRSPHITMGNLYLAKNAPNVDIPRYFNLTENIVCVNSIGNNLQHRLNGCDFDSDTLLVTNDEWLVRGVAVCYDKLKVPVCMVDTSGNAEYEGSPSGLAKLDHDISENKIGEIVNLSQFLNCLFWDLLFAEKEDYDPLDLYYEICKLAVLSGMEIDKAKRMYAVDTGKVLRGLGEYRRKFKEENGGHLPEFFTSMTENENIDGAGQCTANLECPMAYIYDAANNYQAKAEGTKTVLLSELFALDVSDNGDNDTHKKQNIINAVKDAFTQITSLQTSGSKCGNDEKDFYRTKAQKVFEDCLEVVSKNVVNDHILDMLLSEIDRPGASRYGIKSCRYFLFACLLYEKNRLLLSRVKTPEGYEAEDLRPVPIADEQSEYIFGYPHNRFKVES